MRRLGAPRACVLLKINPGLVETAWEAGPGAGTVPQGQTRPLWERGDGVSEAERVDLTEGRDSTPNHIPWVSLGSLLPVWVYWEGRTLSP